MPGDAKYKAFAQGCEACRIKAFSKLCLDKSDNSQTPTTAVV